MHYLWLGINLLLWIGIILIIITVSANTYYIRLSESIQNNWMCINYMNIWQKFEPSYLQVWPKRNLRKIRSSISNPTYIYV